MKQRTIAREARLSGVGLHSGETCTVQVRPGAADSGMVFVRSDLPGKPRLRAHPDLLCQRQRRTAMALGEVEIHTPEHFLAAATGLGIDNLVIELDNQELPGMDGSARDFVNTLREAGVVEQDVDRRSYTVTEAIGIESGDASIVALPYHAGLRITYTLDDHGGVFTGPMMVDLELTEENFATAIAPARTFAMAREVEMLRAAGLGKGANYDNTCVFDGPKPVQNALRFPDEPARHKVLDLIGDLTMATRRVNAHILAVRSGHRENMALVKELNRRIVAAAKPALALDIQRILAVLPHRYPLLLVDRILDFDPGRSITGIKNVTINEPYFAGHFPGNPVMPGVLQVEAMAQTGAVLLLQSEDNAGRVPLFMSMDRVKFRRPIHPGDQMLIEVEALRLRNRMAACRGRVLVKGQLCAEAEIRSILVPRSEV
jgi:UDP-3-O-[3-hydroxymyristoyl] N-acetylglucosamine deacetylase / 3-hydroxyacyl-[acyl-carrier-protein] dehydratase